jgi:hypothetical protein
MSHTASPIPYFYSALTSMSNFLQSVFGSAVIRLYIPVVHSGDVDPPFRTMLTPIKMTGIYTRIRVPCLWFEPGCTTTKEDASGFIG